MLSNTVLIESVRGRCSVSRSVSDRTCARLGGRWVAVAAGCPVLGRGAGAGGVGARTGVP
jgi:hypothetical protein